MQLNHEQKAGTLYIKLGGELDHHSAPQVRKEIDSIITPTVKSIVLDCKDLTFMDSSGIGVLIGRYKLIVKRGGILKVKNVNTQVDKIMRMAGLYNIIGKI